VARVNESEVREYQRMCELTEREAKDILLTALSNLDIADDASWPYVLEVVARLYSEYGRAFAELGRQFYQWCRDVQSDGRGTFVAETFWDDGGHAPLADAVKAHLGDLADDRKTEGGAAEAIANSLGDFAFKAGRDAIRGNLNAEWRTRRPSGANVGFARVPRVGCTCAFCILMASRGFVYRSRESAGGDPANRYHLGCRCSVVPMDASDPVISGYDEAPFLEAYESARDALRSKSAPEEVYGRIALAQARAEAEGRDFGDINRIEIAMRAMHGMH
jgi:hypothetical protein